MIRFEKIPKDICNRLPDLVADLESNPKVVFAYLFGGLAAGEQKPLSDVDIAVFLDSTDDLAATKLELFDRISTMLGTAELDLVILNNAPVSLAGRIVRQKKVIVDKEPFQRHRFESLILREYFDFRIKEDIMFAKRFGIGR